MALSKEVQAGIDFAEQMGFTKIHLSPPAQTRAMMAQAPKNPNPTKVGKMIDKVITGTQGDIPIRLYIPNGEKLHPVISFFHGGGFTLMNIETHDEICRQICANTNAIVMSVDYKLAPENPFPAGNIDSLDATKWLINNASEFNGDGTKLAVVGDSEGGYMALDVAQNLRNENIDLKAQMVAYPVTDHYSSNHQSWEENKEGYILSAEIMKWFWDNFVADSSKFESASPLRTKDFSNLAPAMIMTCNYDPLRDEGKAYADKLRNAGVEVIYENFENVHGFFGTGEMGQEAMQTACEFLVAKLNS